MVLQPVLLSLKRYIKLIWNRYFARINRPHNLEECLNQNRKPNIWRHWFIILGTVPIVYYFYCCYHPSVKATPRVQFDEYLPRNYDAHIKVADVRLSIKKEHTTTEKTHKDADLEYIGKKPTKVIFNNTAFITGTHKIIKLNYTRRRKGQLKNTLFTINKTSAKSKRQRKYCVHNGTGLGPITINISRMLLKDVDKLYPNVGDGGHNVPPGCFSRHKVAILVPFRNRTDNLARFLYNIHPFLLKQNIVYRIFIIEQFGWEHFNKGRLYNAAFMESQKYGNWKCYVFHDVDLLPLDLRIFYSCPKLPRHMSATIQDRSNKIDPKYHVLFGGVTAMSGEHFKKANGYSNAYWGWGGEDHDIFWRLRSRQINVVRYNRSIAVYTAAPHKRGAVNPYRYYLLTSAILRPDKEGLNTIDYKLINTTIHHLYTHIMVDVNPYREDIKNATISIINHYLDMGVGMTLPKRLL